MSRRWTDEQLAVALNPSLTCAQAALQLHRTIGAVHAARMKYPKGRVHELGRSRRWSTADIAVLTDPALTIKDTAEKLGRSTSCTRRHVSTGRSPNNRESSTTAGAHP
ncbi:hypothetical protein [Mycobacteroides abscessus]|uniref:hypothetical protein n=1 Tax=Mycobacteroides abscessus TaxID=36809 RepID=UPI0009A64643|nr:hypothetical protein [Mycobacteroides abscessus]